jgi:ABC-type glutathione transport system ATPase component
MITLKNITLNDSKNKTFLRFDESISFENNTINFIIGESGTGKTSLIDFLSSPFTADPVKNGEIIIKNGKTEETIRVKNSSSVCMRKYMNFVKNSAAYIPQKTDSFHPAIPVRKQMYDYCSLSLPGNQKLKEQEFDRLLEELSPKAGWDKVVADAGNPDALIMFDKKEYCDPDTGKSFVIVDTQKNSRASTGGYNVKIYQDEFSTGQKQRLFILMGLIQFRLSNNPILLADEFLVNFTYCEAEDVLKSVMSFFAEENKPGKTAVFILHDLSFDFLRNLGKEKNVKLFAAEKDRNYRPEKNDAPLVQRITKKEMLLYDFFHNELKDETKIFEKFRASYEIKRLPLDGAGEFKTQDGVIKEITIKNSPKLSNDINEGDLYKDIHFTIRKGRFVVLTGFSGCGKSTFCDQFLRESIQAGSKSIFRYLPSQMHSSLSEDSQILVKRDLGLIYGFYNGVKNLEECGTYLKKTLKNMHLFEKEPNDADLKAFLEQKIFNLSGGQLQRYWFARLLFDYGLNDRDAEFIVLDESIASLDCMTKNRVILMLLESALVKRGMTIFLVSHDLRDIGVIYETLRCAGAENLFEHYEMFNQNIYRVMTPFPEYRENLIVKKANTYRTLDGAKEYRLAVKGKNGSDIK